jgi:hypothetical protein
LAHVGTVAGKEPPVEFALLLLLLEEEEELLADVVGCGKNKSEA